MPARTRIGISGWTYPPWRKVFYPEGLTQSRELEYATRVFETIEINGSFYSLMRPSAVAAWSAAAPDGFVFAVKGSRYITHMLKLRGVEHALANFFASGVLALGEKLGPILWQLPPQLGFNAERIESFLALLPRTTGDAARLARKHDHRVTGRAFTRALTDVTLRYALEVRHPTFVVPEFIRILRRYNVASCVADSAGLFPVIEDVTADFVYVRLHGKDQLYVSGYDDASLDDWAARVSAWSHGAQPPRASLAAPGLAPRTRKQRDVYVYFDNDAKVRAPFDALALRAKLRGEPVPAHPPSLADVRETARVDWPLIATRPRRAASSRARNAS
jgi:uncharacterized protein YecE (DUF72 family)